MTPQELHSITFNYAIVSGIVFYIIYMILSYFLRKKALKKIENNLLEGEYIVYEAKLGFLFKFLFIFGTGALFGGILLFFIYPEIQYLAALVNRQFLPLDILAELVGMYIVFQTSCEKFVITNKRMIYAWTFNFLYFFKGFFGRFDNINYTDIKNFNYENFLIINDSIYIDLKNDKRFIISGYKKLKDIYQIIKKYC